MIWGWLDYILNRREINDDLREMDAMMERAEWMKRDLDRRVAEAFTPEEYEAVRKRCEAQLAQFMRANSTPSNSL